MLLSVVCVVNAARAVHAVLVPVVAMVAQVVFGGACVVVQWFALCWRGVVCSFVGLFVVSCWWRVGVWVCWRVVVLCCWFVVLQFVC